MGERTATVSRRTLLGSLGAVPITGLAGCFSALSGEEAPSGTLPSTNRSGATGTPTPQCGGETGPPPTPDPSKTDVTMAYPERPAALTEDSVGEFAREYERVYGTYVHEDQDDEVNPKTVRVVSTWAIDEGGRQKSYVVHLEVWLAFVSRENGTVQSLGDTFYDVQYLISERGVWRTRVQQPTTTVDPADPGFAIQCFGE